MNKLVLLFLMLNASVLCAQKFSVKGQLADTLGAPLPSATVLLLSAADSSLVNFSVTNTSGAFEIRNVSQGNYLFKVTFIGFASYAQKISSPAGNVLDLGSIRLEPASTELAAVEIAAERAPVTVKRDTIEFNAGSFKTKENAIVEDLLKKLPGVEVDTDGNITAQGEQVKRVTVDGKNFFGTDPKLATRNLPANAIDKVQVFDKKSDQATFSGIDDGQREKTINLALKEEKRNGVFGNMMAGAGTDDRFQARANINKFSKTRQLSFLAMGNNVNQQGFSMEEYMNFTGGSQQMMRGGAVRMQFSSDNQNGVPLNFGNRANGIMTNYAAGLNLNNEFNKKTELNGSYFFNYLDHKKDQSTERENFLPDDRSYRYDERSIQDNSNSNHRVNATLDHKIDSMNLLKATVNVVLNETDMFSKSESATTTPDGQMQNTSRRTALSTGTNTALNGSLLWRHKFNKKGRTFSANFQYGLTDNDRKGSLEAENTFRGSDSISSIDQDNFQKTMSTNYGTTLSYTEPLGKRRYLEGNYSYRVNYNDMDREVFDVADGESTINNVLSNKYNSAYQYHRGGINYRIAKSNYNFVMGASLQQTTLEGELTTFQSTIKRSWENVLPAVRFNYDFSDTKHLRFDYETSVQEPSIQQLQPVVDNSDPLNLYVGNPSLRPAYSQSWRVNFMTFNPSTFLSFFAFADIDYETNAIVNSQNIDERLVRTTSPVNVGSNLSLRTNSNLSFPITKLKSRFSIGADFRNQQSLALLNDRENQINQNTYGGNIRYTYRYQEIFDFSVSADVDQQLTSYQFDQPDQKFINSTYSAESNLTFLKKFQFSGAFEYLKYENHASGFSTSIPLLDLSLSMFMLKNKAGELKLSGHNLLDKALGVSQTANINYLERQTINSLGRYVMLSFTYALNKQLNPMGMRSGGRMMRVIR
jgi:hypothetical protein